MQGWGAGTQFYQTGGDDLAFGITATAPIFKGGNSSDELIGGLHYMLQRCTDWSGAQYLEPRLVWTNFQDSSRQLKWATTVSLQNTFQQNNCRLHGDENQTWKHPKHYRSYFVQDY